MQLTGVYGGSDAMATAGEPCHLVLVGAGWQDKPVADPSGGHQGCLNVDNFGQAYEKCGMLNHRLAPTMAGCPLSPAWPPGGTSLPNVLWNAQFAMFDVANVVVRGLNATPTTGTTFYLQRNTRGVQLAGLRVLPLNAALIRSATHNDANFRPIFKANLGEWQNSIGAIGGVPAGDPCEFSIQYSAPLKPGVNVLPPPTTGTSRFAWIENRAEGIDISRCVLQGIDYALLSGDGYFSYFRDNIWRTDNFVNRIRRLLFRNNFVVSGGKEVQLYGMPMSARTYEWPSNGQQGATDPWYRLGDLELPEWVRAWAAIRIQGNWFESALAGRSVQYTGPVAGAGSLDSATAAIGLAANVPALQGLTVKWLERQPGNLTHDLNPGEPPCAEWLGGFRGVQGAVVDNLDFGVPRAADLNALGPDEAVAIAQLRAVPPGNGSGLVSAPVPTAPGCVLHPATPAGAEPKIFAAPALAPAIAGGNLVRFGGGLTKLDRGGELGLGFAGDLGSSPIGRGYSNRVTVRGNTIDHGVQASSLSHLRDVEVTENRACDMMAGDGPGVGGIFALTVPADNVLIAANEVAGARNPCNVEPALMPAWCNFETCNGSVFHRQRATAFYLDPAFPVGMALDPTKPAPVRVGHNIAWRAEYGIVQTPVRESFRAYPLAAVSFYGTGQPGGVSPIKLNYQLPVTTDAAVTSGNLLGAASYTHALVHRVVAPFTKGKVFGSAADSQYGKFGWGWRNAGAQGDRIAVSTDLAVAQPCVDGDGQCSQCSDQGICVCGDKGLCTMAGKRIFPYQQGILAGTNASAQSTVCQWASKEAWDASPQAKCIGKKPADGVNFKGVDANAVWLPFSQADARLGVRCCEAADEAMQLDDAAKVCPATVRSKYDAKLGCPKVVNGKLQNVETGATCSRCATPAAGPGHWRCGALNSGPLVPANPHANCTYISGLPTGAQIVLVCPADGFQRGGEETGAEAPLGHLARHKNQGGTRLDVCAARSCEASVVPGQICVPGTLASVSELLCASPACLSTFAGQACGWADNTASSCPAGYKP